MNEDDGVIEGEVLPQVTRTPLEHPDKGLHKPAHDKKCLAKTRSKNGEPCQLWAMPNGRCRYHGGKSLSGMAHPRYKDGKYSEYLPDRLVSIYQESQNDPHLLELRGEVSLLDARLVDVLGRVDSGESGEAWEKLHDWNRRLTAARKRENADDMAEALEMIQSLIREGYADNAAWRDIDRLVERRRKLVESERKSNQTMTAEQFMLLAGAVVAVFRDAVQRHVKDEGQRRQVLSEASQNVHRLISDRDS